MDATRLKEQPEHTTAYHVFADERFVDINIYQFGHEKCLPLHSYGPYVRNHFLFHYVIAGRGELMASDEKGKNHSYVIEGNQGFLIFPGQECTYSADPRTPWEYTWLEFDGLRVREALLLSGLSKAKPVYFPKNRTEGDKVKDIMLYIVGHSTSSSLHLTGQAFLFLDSLVESSKNKRTAIGSRLRDFYIREAMNFIEQNYTKDISVEDIADFCSLNRTYFGRVFKDTVGKTPQDFLIEYRMIKASNLLKMTRLPIKDIALQVGYVNQLHFSRTFKSVFTTSPREWRRTHLLPTIEE